jgi:hypothetical protein
MQPFNAQSWDMEELGLLFAFINNFEVYRELIGSVQIDHKKMAMEILVNEIKSACSLMHMLFPINDNGGEDSGVIGSDDGEAEEV